MMFAASQIASPAYYEGVAAEFEAVANVIARTSSTNDALVTHLRHLADEIRDGTDWANAA